MKNFVFVVMFLLGTYQGFSQNRPNILWVVIEDTSPQYIGCYGDEHANTPNIDRLAKNGLRFTNAYSTGTVCSPSRSAIITGVSTYKIGTGNHRSAFPIPDAIKGFPTYLRASGYYTSNNSKTDYNTSAARRIIQESWDESSNKAGWWNREAGQPFFSVFNFADSHQSRTMTNPYELYEKQVLAELPDSLEVADNVFDMPPFYNDTPEMRKQVARVYNGIALADYKIGLVLDRLEKEGLADSTIVFFYSDHGQGMPRGKTNSIGQGYKVPFVIHIPEIYQHLTPWKKEGIVVDEHINFVDLAATVLSLAEVDKPEYLDGRSFLGKEREEASTFIFGSNDRADNSPSLDRSVIKDNLIYTRNFMPYSSEIRWIHYFLFGEISQLILSDAENGKLNELQQSLVDPKDPETLYNLIEDPWEEKNLINDPAYSAHLTALRSALSANIIESEDILFAGEYELRKLEKTTPYEFRQSEDYAISEIWKAAQLSGFRGEKVARNQIKLLGHLDKLVRLWAAIGLKSQSNLSLSQNKKLASALKKENYPPVKAILASLVYDCGSDEYARKVLEDFAFSNDPDLALLTLDMVMHMSKGPDFISFIETEFNKLKSEKRRGMGNVQNAAEVALFVLNKRPIQMEQFW